MHQLRAVGTKLHTQLTHGLKKRQRLNVTSSTTNLDNRHVKTGSTFIDLQFDLVSNMRDDLNGSPQILSTTLFIEHVLIDATSTEAVFTSQTGANKTLVMAQIQIGFSAVFRDEHFAMLIRAHGTGIDVDIRIHLDQRHLEATGIKQRRKRCGGNTLAKG